MSGDWSVMYPLDGRDLVASNSTPILGWMEKNLPEFEHARVRAAIDEADRQRSRRSSSNTRWSAPTARSGGRTRGRSRSSMTPGNIIEWFGTASDVTRRKQAEAAAASA